MNHNTPIEKYIVKDREVHVKREDLSTNPPMPPLSKLRGASILLEKLHNQGVRTVGNVDSEVSKSGLGVAAICKELDMSCVLAYPDGKNGIPPSLQKAKELGAELLPLRPNYIRILYAQMKNHVEKQGGYALPFGLTCVESTLAVAEEAKTVPSELLTGTLVICVGTGTILSGVLLGLKQLPKIIGISSGMSFQTQERNIRHLLLEANVSQARLSEINDKLTILPPIMPYAQRCDIETPFLSHPNYDKKAWKYLIEHIEQLEAPIIMWNVGA